MRDGKIIVVTAILRRQITIKETSDGFMRVSRPLQNEKILIVFRDLEKHPVSNDLEYMTAKNFFKHVRIPGTKEKAPLSEKI